jgi:hypothetical protein
MLRRPFPRLNAGQLYLSSKDATTLLTTHGGVGFRLGSKKVDLIDDEEAEEEISGNCQPLVHDINRNECVYFASVPVPTDTNEFIVLVQNGASSMWLM